MIAELVEFNCVELIYCKAVFITNWGKYNKVAEISQAGATIVTK